MQIHSKELQFFLSSSSLQTLKQFQVLLSFIHIPLSAGDTPHPCTASSSCPVRASDTDPTLGEDVSGTAAPLSTKPCTNLAKRQIRHQKPCKSTQQRTQLTNWQTGDRTSALSLIAPPWFLLLPSPFLFSFFPLLLLFICPSTSCLL